MFSTPVILSKQLWWVYKEDFYLPDVLLIDFDPTEPVALQTQGCYSVLSVCVYSQRTYILLDRC